MPVKTNTKIKEYTNNPLVSFARGTPNGNIVGKEITQENLQTVVQNLRVGGRLFLRKMKDNNKFGNPEYAIDIQSPEDVAAAKEYGKQMKATRSSPPSELD